MISLGDVHFAHKTDHVLWAPRLRNRNTSSSTYERVWSPALLVTMGRPLHCYYRVSCCCCCGLLLWTRIPRMVKAAGTLRRRRLGNRSERQWHHRGGTAAAVPRRYSHVSMTMVLSVHLCPNRWSACPVSRRHLPRLRATEPEAMMIKTLYLH